MKQRLPKNTEKYHWTNHVWQKMRYYNLSESRIKRILRHPQRVEKGIVPNTIACMQPSGSKRKTLRQAQGREEIWVMFQQRNKGKKKTIRPALRRRLRQGEQAQSKIIIISAWRYPGVSPIGKKIEIPQDTLEFLQKRNFE